MEKRLRRGLRHLPPSRTSRHPKFSLSRTCAKDELKDHSRETAPCDKTGMGVPVAAAGDYFTNPGTDGVGDSLHNQSVAQPQPQFPDGHGKGSLRTGHALAPLNPGTASECDRFRNSRLDLRLWEQRGGLGVRSKALQGCSEPRPRPQRQTALGDISGTESELKEQLSAVAKVSRSTPRAPGLPPNVCVTHPQAPGLYPSQTSSGGAQLHHEWLQSG